MEFSSQPCLILGGQPKRNADALTTFRRRTQPTRLQWQEMEAWVFSAVRVDWQLCRWFTVWLFSCGAQEFQTPWLFYVVLLRDTGRHAKSTIVYLPIQVVPLLVNLTDIPVLLLLPSVTFRALRVEVVLCAQNGCTAKYLNQGVIPKDMPNNCGWIHGHFTGGVSTSCFQRGEFIWSDCGDPGPGRGGAQLRDQIGTGGNCALSTLGLNWHEVSILVAWFRFHPHSYIPKF